MNLRILVFFIVQQFILGNLFAQSVPVPASKDQAAILLSGGVIHIATGEVIKDGAVGFKKGKIVVVGSAADVSKEGWKVINVNGKHVYPGLIAANTKIGLTEIDLVRATHDFKEIGSYNPNVRSIIAYNTDSRVTPTIRSNGILLAQIVPQGGRISGTSSIVQLDAWNWEDAAYKMDDGIHLNWPNMYVNAGWWAEPKNGGINEKYDEQLRNVEAFFEEAKAYGQDQQPNPKNIRFESMKKVFNKQQQVFIHVSFAKEIIAAINFAKKHEVRMVIVGGRDSWLVADIIKEHNIPVILSSIHSLPGYQDDELDVAFKTPFHLKEAGVKFALSIGGGWETRNLMFLAGTASTYGLTKEEALMSITKNVSEILGISDSVGTLSVGKDATIIVSTGDILDMRTSKIEHAFIKGRAIDLNNKQKELYYKFRNKYAD